MRRQMTFSIEGRSGQFTVWELTLKELQLLLDPQLQQLPAAELFHRLADTFLPLCSNIPRELFMDLAPSEVDFVWEKFREVNQTFFGLSTRLGLKELYESLRPMLLATFGASAVNWLKRGMVEQLTMGTASSSPLTASTSVSSEAGSATPPSPSG